MTTTRWSEGEEVRVRGGRWSVAAVTPHAGGSVLHLRGHGGVARTLLTPFDRPQRLPPSNVARRLHPRRWLHVVRRALCRARPFGGICAPPGIALLPYQLEPAIAFIRHGAARVLLADGVGLGKTIQAGLLLHTLGERQPLLRALVITPAGLREQWAYELARHFSIAATVADAAWLRVVDRALPGGVVPWALPGVFITSFDFIKQPEVLHPLEGVAWDLLIVDEAHNATLVSARRAAIDTVARRSMRVLLLTATPHSGDTAQFDALCSIGATATSAPVVLFRRSRADVSTGPARHSALLRVRPTGDERHLHRLLDRYADAICRERGTTSHASPRLVATILKKRALSSAASLGISVRRRLDLLAGAAPESQMLLPLDDDVVVADEVDDKALGMPALGDAALERRLLVAIARAAEAVRGETKPAFLLRLLRRTREPAIVFTEFRDTLLRLHLLLVRAGHEVTLLHGGLLPAERAAAQRRFNERGGVLLATDAASEGLNLHENCRLVVHYELPWTPARIEQRTGRVDRIGQRRTVHEILLVGGHAAERLVLAPLARRAARVRSVFGGEATALDRLAESLVADAVMAGVPLAVPETDSHDATADLRAEAEAEVPRLLDLRCWCASSVTGRFGTVPNGAVVTSRRRRRLRTSLYLYSLTLSSDAGRIEHGEIVAVRARDQPRVEDVLASVARQVDAVREAFARVNECLAVRAHELTSALPSSSHALVQAGLFDRRATLASHERAIATADVVEGLGTYAASALTPSLRLIAILQE